MGDDTRGSEVIEETSEAMELRREDDSLLSLWRSEENLKAGMSMTRSLSRCPFLIGKGICSLPLCQ